MLHSRLIIGLVFAASLSAAENWTDLAGQLTGKIAVFETATQQVFIRGTDNAIWTNQLIAPGTWSGWISLGGSFASDPAVYPQPSNAPQVFARGADGSVWTNAQSEATGLFGSWQNLGGYIISDIAVTRSTLGPNVTRIFGIGGDHAVWTASQDSDGSWSPWTSLGGYAINDPAVIIDPGGIIHLFALGPDNTLWTDTLPSGGSWSGWAGFGGSSTGDASVVLGPSGQVEVFIRALNSASVINYTAQTSGSWSPLLPLDVSPAEITSDPSAVFDAGQGRVFLFWRGSDNALWTVTQQGYIPTPAFGTAQSLGALLGGPPTGFFTYLGDSDLLQVFVPCIDNTLWYISETSPGNWN